jgi:hypothetical protein
MQMNLGVELYHRFPGLWASPKTPHFRIKTGLAFVA